MTFKRLLGIAMSVCAVALLAGSVGAGAARTPGKPGVNLSTKAGVKAYLRSLGISPRGVVIQRGARNYAGPRCPGKRWTCTRSHRVIQIASHRGKNSFRCSLARCVVVQVTRSLLAKNNATCIRTTGITQSCAITQSGTGPNTAGVYMSAVKILSGSGLTQSATQTATIAQTSTAQSAPLGAQNTACVAQIADIESTTRAKTGVPVSANFDVHQSIQIAQDAHVRGNVVQNANASGGCLSGDLQQSQTISSTAVGTGSITQNENRTVAGRNMLLDIEQNQSNGYFGTATGENNAAFSQTSSLTALATTPNGPVNQWQSRPESDGGGVDAIVKQDSRDKSTASATQTETQCARAVTIGTPDCDVQTILQRNWTQTQFGPVGGGGCCSSGHGRAGRHFLLRKGSNPSIQTGFGGDEFTINQESKQDVDAAPKGFPEQVMQANLVQGDCSTPGSCNLDQKTTVDGQTTTNTQSGQNVHATIDCTGSACTTGSGNVLVAGTGDFGSTEPNDNLTQLLTSAGYSVTESATLPADLSNFGQVWWVDANPPTSVEQNQLIGFAQSGKGVFLTGERPCCEALNAADQSIVNAVVVGGGITVGGQDDVCGCNAPLPVNPGVVGNVATQPFNVTTWQPAAPGGMANVPDSSVFSYYQPGDPSTRQTVAAVWDRPSVVGNGRLVVFMDINWTEAAWRAANWSDVAQNVAFFLSGLTSPPGPVVTANVVPAAAAFFSAQAQATLARTASGGASSTK